MKNKMNKVIELTPEKFLCAGLGCPSVFSTEDGELYVIGKIVNKNEVPDSVLDKIGEGETVVEIPRDLISKLNL